MSLHLPGVSPLSINALPVNDLPKSAWGKAVEKLVSQHGKSWAVVAGDVLEAESKARGAQNYTSFAALGIFKNWATNSAGDMKKLAAVHVNKVHTQLTQMGISLASIQCLPALKSLALLLVAGVSAMLASRLTQNNA